MHRLCVRSALGTLSKSLEDGLWHRSSWRKFSYQSLIPFSRRVADVQHGDGYRASLVATHKTLLSSNLVSKIGAMQKRGVGNTELCSTPNSRGLVLGVYSNEEDKLDIGILTENGAKYNEVLVIKPLILQNR